MILFTRWYSYFRAFSLKSRIRFQYAKIFERILAVDITNHFIDNDLLSEAQHGFRNKRILKTAFQSILEKWEQSVETKQTILALFVDFKKAFYLIYPELLFIKLFQYCLDYASLCLIRDYFKNHSLVTFISKVTSERLPSHWGVLQGFILVVKLGRLAAKPLSAASQSALRKCVWLPDSQSDKTAIKSAPE